MRSHPLEEMQQTLWTQTYEINSFLVNPEKRLGLFALLNLLQDAAWVHATHLGLGYEESLRQGRIWALFRQKLVMQEWPAWGQSIEIRTWARPYQGVLALRDYQMFVDGRCLGEAATSWVMLDVKSHAPLGTNLPKVPSRADLALPWDAPKLAWRDDLEVLAEYRVRNSDLDMHNHVNNTRYAQWILDSVDREWHSRLKLEAYEINFLGECPAAEEVILLKSPLNEDSAWIVFQGMRARDRKPIFAARLLVGAA